LFECLFSMTLLMGGAELRSAVGDGWQSASPAPGVSPLANFDLAGGAEELKSPAAVAAAAAAEELRAEVAAGAETRSHFIST